MGSLKFCMVWGILVRAHSIIFRYGMVHHSELPTACFSLGGSVIINPKASFLVPLFSHSCVQFSLPLICNSFDCRELFNTYVILNES